MHFAPEYMSFLGEWITGTYKAFNDADKYTILVYLFRKNITFYYENFIKVSYDTFYKSDHIDIEKINIVEIAKALGIPKETTRRKVSELEKDGVIKKRGKHLIIDKTAFKQFLKAEYLLKQRKISEASQLLNHTIDKNSTLKIIPMISLRRAILLVKMKKFNQALNQISLIENSLLGDKSIILAGQIYEQVYNNNEKAMEYYMRIINNYTNSIYFEPVRYHIRMLKNS